MKNFLRILILPVAVVAILGFAPRAFAVSPMTATFDPDPIFGEVLNFLPGDIKTGDVTVINNTEDEQDVYAESVNGLDPDGFGSQLRLRVLEGATEHYNDIFSDFLSTGPIPLSSLDAGDTTTYTFEVSFIDSEDNDYMGRSLSFDLCIGFSDGTFQCGSTEVSAENPVVEEDSPSDGGGGGGGGLIIFNEFVSEVAVGDGTAVVEWDTNLLSTSQVIYGLSSGAPYLLDINNLPNFGYPLGTLEDGTKVSHHNVLLTGLVGGETYVYRVVSRASPPTISAEHTFTMPTFGSGNIILTQAGGEAMGIEITGKTNTSLDLDAEATSTEDTKEITENNSGLLAFALGGLGFNYLILLFLLLIIILFLFWTFIIRKRKNNQ